MEDSFQNLLLRGQVPNTQGVPGRSNLAYDLTGSPVDGETLDRSGNGNDQNHTNGWYTELTVNPDKITFTPETDVAVAKVVARVRGDDLLTSEGTMTSTNSGEWEDVELVKTVPAGTEWTFGTDGVSFWTGDLADIRFFDASDNLIERVPHPCKVGTLDGLPVFGQAGGTGTFTGCDGVNGEGPDEEVVGLEEYGDYPWADGTFDIALDQTYTLTEGDEFSFDLYLPATVVDNSTLFSDSGANLCRIDTGGGTIGWTIEGSTIFDAPAYDDLIFSGWNTLVAKKVSGNLYLTVNGIDHEFRTSAPDYPISLLFQGVGRPNLSSGIIKNVRFNGTLIAEGNGVTSAEWGGGTVNGNPATVADKLRTVPQMLLQDWNQGGVFETFTSADGSVFEEWLSSSVSTSGGKTVVTSTADGASWGRYDGALITDGFTLNRFRATVKNLSSGTSRCRVNNGSGTHFWSAFFDENIGAGLEEEIDITFTASSGSTNRIALSFILDSGDQFEVYDVTLDHIYPDTVHIPASLSDPAQDARGNPIANPRGKLFNPTFVAGDNATMAEDASLDAVKCWVLAVDYRGDDDVLLDLGTPSISVASDVVTTSGITSPTIYVSDGTGFVETAAITEGKHLIMVTTEAPTDCGPIVTDYSTPLLGYTVPNDDLRNQIHRALRSYTT